MDQEISGDVMNLRGKFDEFRGKSQIRGKQVSHLTVINSRLTAANLRFLVAFGRRHFSYIMSGFYGCSYALVQFAPVVIMSGEDKKKPNFSYSHSNKIKHAVGDGIIYSVFRSCYRGHSFFLQSSLTLFRNELAKKS